MTIDDLLKRLADNPDLANLNKNVNPDSELEEIGRQVVIKGQRDEGADATTILLQQIAMLKLPEPQMEYRFCPERKWRADLAWPELKVIVEIEGGVWTNGRHIRGKGFIGDIEKYNRAAILGYRLLRFTPEMVKDQTAVSEIMEALQ